MQTLVSMLLGNAIVAGGLAIAAIVMMRLRRPALAHALWVLVLIKLVTPPVWEVGVPVPQWSLDQPVEVAETNFILREPVLSPPERTVPSPGTRGEAAGEGLLKSNAAPVPAEPSPDPLPVRQAQGGPEYGARVTKWEWPSPSVVLGMIWLTGSLLWIGFVIVRIHRFNRLARNAVEASSEIQDRADILARALELRRSPPIQLIPGNISPMLWHDIRSTRLLIPRQLLHSLDPEQRDALLLHELAHLKRKDHLTRWLEVVVTAILWWHPLVWIARRGLREAEEQCCDAWVLWAMPGSARRYADALVDTLDFLAASPQSLPPGASGLGGLHSLQRRLTMIFTNTPPRTLSWTGRIVILGLLGLLPLGFVQAQDAPPIAPSASVSPVQPTAPAAQAPGPAPAVGTSETRPLFFVLTGILNEDGIFHAYVENVARGGLTRVKAGERIANGVVQEIRLGEILFNPDGAERPTAVAVGQTLEGRSIGSLEAYRTQIRSARSVASNRGQNPGRIVLPDLNRDDLLSVEERLRLQRDAAVAMQPITPQEAQPAQAAIRGGQFGQPRAAQDGTGRRFRQAPADAASPAPPDRDVVLALLEAMADADQFVQSNAQQSLISMGVGAVPIYIEAASSPSPASRASAMRMLQTTLARHSPYQMLPEAAYTAGSRGRGGRGGGGFGGGGGGRGQIIGGWNPVTGFLDVQTPTQALDLQAKIAPVAIKALEDTDLNTRLHAIWILGLTIDQIDLALPALARAMESNALTVRRQAIRSVHNIALYRAGVAPHLPVILKQLGDPDQEMRLATISLLGQLGPAAKSAAPELLKALKDEDPAIRAAAAAALGQIQASPAPLMGNAGPPALQVGEPSREQAAAPAKLIWRGLDLSAAPVSTDSSKLPDIWAERPPGSRSFEVRADVTVIPAREPLMSIAIYWLRSANRFYVQYDSGASSTHHFYGPFEGDPNQVLAPPTSRPAGR